MHLLLLCNLFLSLKTNQSGPEHARRVITGRFQFGDPVLAQHYCWLQLVVLALRLLCVECGVDCEGGLVHPSEPLHK